MTSIARYRAITYACAVTAVIGCGGDKSSVADTLRAVAVADSMAAAARASMVAESIATATAVVVAPESLTAKTGATAAPKVAPKSVRYRVGIQETGLKACSVNASLTDIASCSGFFALDYADPSSGNVSKIIAQLNRISASPSEFWGPPSGYVAREPNTMGEESHLQIIGLKDAPRDSLLNALGKHGMVLAILQAKSGSKEDKRYGISADPAMLPYYFIVASNWKAGAARKHGVVVAEWQVYGVRKDGQRVVATKRQGSLIWCDDKQSDGQRADRAGFTSCAKQSVMTPFDEQYAAQLNGHSFVSQLREELGGKPKPKLEDLKAALSRILNRNRAKSAPTVAVPQALLESAVLVFENLDADPAWMVCGAGSCVAEESR